MTDTSKPNPFTDVNPYRAGELPKVIGSRPGALTAICIVVVVLGVLGLFSGVMKGVNVLFGAKMQQAFGSMGAASPQQAKVQQEMNAATAAVITRFAAANTVLCIAQVLLCGGLVYSGLKTLGLKTAGRKLLLAICVCMLVFEIGQMITVVLQQLSLSPIMELYLPRMMKDSSGNNAGAEKFGQIIARVSIIVGIVMQCGWTLTKFVFYAFAIRYLGKATVIALFNPSPTSAPLKPEMT
ncbi:MAG: hypothetical protein ABI614_13385 [Planctomycetota bacterium]